MATPVYSGPGSVGPAPFMSPLGTQLSTPATAVALPVLSQASSQRPYFTSIYPVAAAVPPSAFVPAGANETVKVPYFSTIGPLGPVDTGNRALPRVISPNQNGSYYTQ